MADKDQWGQFAGFRASRESTKPQKLERDSFMCARVWEVGFLIDWSLHCGLVDAASQHPNP